MRDAADKQFRDSRAATWQALDVDYVQKQLRKEMPTKRAQQVQRAIDLCKRYVQPSEGREKLLACVREKLQ